MPVIPRFILRQVAWKAAAATPSSLDSYRELDDLIRPDLPKRLLSDLGEAAASRGSATHHLLCDLARSGWQGRLAKVDAENANLVLKEPDRPYSKQQIRQAMEHRRNELIRQNRAWLRHSEPTIMQHFVDGAEILPLSIAPELEECRTQEQNDIFRYCRYLSSVPYSEYVGRRMHFLIRDASLRSRPIMGIAALGSSLLQIRCRDEWIGWQAGELRNVKALRIAHVMDLYVAVAIPPYSDLLAGKLLCYMMISNEVRGAFGAKYIDKVTLGKKRNAYDLVMLVTTSIYGQHSSQYNRLRFNDELLYIPVGETAGFGTWHISEETFIAFRRMLSLSASDLSHRFGAGANWRFRVVREGMDRLGFPADRCLRHGHSRGVYVAPLAHNSREFLRGQTDKIEYFNYSLRELVSYWYERWLCMRSQNASVMERVRQFRANSLRLTPLLEPH